MAIRLYSYWRSTAAYRVRLALALKGIDCDIVPISLLPGLSEHRNSDYERRNPQMLVPFLEDGDIEVAQSMAILEYLEERYGGVALLPESMGLRASVRSFCQSICCDIHPLNNLRVLRYLGERLDLPKEQRDAWYAHWIHEGFRSAERTAMSHTGDYVFGDKISMADVCLIPQMYNAHRFNVPLDDYPELLSIEKRCLQMPAFDNAIPERQPDAAS